MLEECKSRWVMRVFHFGSLEIQKLSGDALDDAVSYGSFVFRNISAPQAPDNPKLRHARFLLRRRLPRPGGEFRRAVLLDTPFEVLLPNRLGTKLLERERGSPKCGPVVS